MKKQARAGVASASKRAACGRLKREAKKKKKIGARSNSSSQNVDALLQAAEGMRSQGKLKQAENLCRDILKSYPGIPKVHSAVGLVLEQQDRRDEALEYFKKAVALAPREFPSWLRLGRCHYMLKDYCAALIAFKSGMALHPSHLGTLLFVGLTLQHLEQPEEALAVFTTAVELHPHSADAHLKKGKQHQVLGDFSAAGLMFNRAIELDPKLAEAYFQLSAIGEAPTELEQSVAQLKRLSIDADLTSEKRASALFAAARILQKQKQYADAFDLYRRANETLREIVNFDRDAVSRFVDNSIKAFTPDVFEIHRQTGSRSNEPIFILGMPRSGTTLIEQIISSHPEITAGGEEQKMSNLVNALLRESSGPLHYPADIARIAPESLLSIGEQYLGHMRRRFPDAPRMTDKNPFNFCHIGLISILFPNASIIHCHRDPLDTCLSCYFQYFGDAKSLDFTTDLEDLGHFYNDYQRMMAHWHDILPGRIFDVCYEKMVADQEGLSRAIIAHLDLPWADACLKFNENERGVDTASQWQVRQPIYDSSVGRWREYESELAPLMQVLDRAA